MQLQLSLQTQHALSQRQLASTQILQLSAEQLRDKISQALEENPMLQIQEPPLTTQTWADYESRSPDAAIASLHSAPSSRTDSLLNAIQLSRATPRTQALCALIIDALDDNGYFTAAFDDLLPADTEQINHSEWQTALALVQQLSPPGIGARSAQESLSLQVQAQTDLSAATRQALLEFIHTHLASWYQGTQAHDAKDSSTPDPQQEATLLRLLQRLHPKPGLLLTQAQAVALQADVYVRPIAGQWQVAPNPATMPTLSVHPFYAACLHQGPKSPLQHKLKQAQELVHSVQRRHSTICRVAQAIVAHQALFFELGEPALRPLGLHQLAQELGLHESTLSRATANKYMDTPRGIYSFRYFLPQELATTFGGQCSSALAKAQIKALIRKENPAAPLSDVQLHQHLRATCIDIAKRTISKYRQQLHIPSASERKLAHQRLSPGKT